MVCKGKICHHFLETKTSGCTHSNQMNDTSLGYFRRLSLGSSLLLVHLKEYSRLIQHSSGNIGNILICIFIFWKILTLLWMSPTWGVYAGKCYLPYSLVQCHLNKKMSRTSCYVFIYNECKSYFWRLIDIFLL